LFQFDQKMKDGAIMPDIIGWKVRRAENIGDTPVDPWPDRRCQAVLRPIDLGGHRKTGHLWSLQNRPLWMAEDVIVLPCPRVFGQGVDGLAG
jgi:hypothetical protein